MQKIPEKSFCFKFLFKNSKSQFHSTLFITIKSNYNLGKHILQTVHLSPKERPYCNKSVRFYICCVCFGFFLCVFSPPTFPNLVQLECDAVLFYFTDVGLTRRFGFIFPSVGRDSVRLVFFVRTNTMRSTASQG